MTLTEAASCVSSLLQEAHGQLVLKKRVKELREAQELKLVQVDTSMVHNEEAKRVLQVIEQAQQDELKRKLEVGVYGRVREYYRCDVPQDRARFYGDRDEELST